jgi:hypothetical protein
MAGSPPPAPPISRQSHSKTRDRTRESGVFMRTMVGFMRKKICGKPRVDVVAMLANIAFPRADFTTDNVRAAIQATTRPARRRKTDALGPENLTECIAEIPPCRVKIIHRDSSDGGVMTAIPEATDGRLPRVPCAQTKVGSGPALAAPATRGSARGPTMRHFFLGWRPASARLAACRTGG